MPTRDIGWAIRGMKGGKKYARAGWNGKGMWIAMYAPSSGDRMTLPFVYMRTVQGELIPWLASQADLLAEDWEEVE